MRIATYATGLGRDGPGLMLRDLRSGEDAQAEAALDVIAALDADIVLLGGVDWDAGHAGLAALRARLAERGAPYAHAVHLPPVTGRPSGFDLDGNGRLGEARDALGYGRFTGAGGLALLSRVPLGPAEDLSAILWADRSEAAGQVLPQGARAVVPLASVAQWVVPAEAGGRRLSLVTLAASTPVFDGPEDRNGLRNRDELALAAELAGRVEGPVLLGRANLDPADGEGRRAAIAALLAHPALQDPAPRSAGGAAQPPRPDHAGDPALDTAAWQGPGPLRVDYVLPSRALRVVAAGVHWPAPGTPEAARAEAAGPGRAVWVELDLGPTGASLTP